MGLLQKNEGRKTALFGTGGNPKSFYDDGYVKTVDVMKWLADKKIDSYEYQGGQKLDPSMTMMKAIRQASEENNIKISIHAPYYIALASLDDEIRASSVKRAVKSVRIAKEMGAYIIVMHPGGFARTGRSEAFNLTVSTLSSIVEEVYKLDSEYAENVQIGIETMGRENELGTVDDVIKFCKIDKILRPVVDFGHLYARSIGERFLSRDDYREVFENIGENLSDDSAKYLHCHFSKIEYANKGEKRHLKFETEGFGPAFEPLGEILAENNLCPNIICESDGTMDTDALYMKKIYFDIKQPRS